MKSAFVILGTTLLTTLAISQKLPGRVTELNMASYAAAKRDQFAINLLLSSTDPTESAVFASSPLTILLTMLTAGSAGSTREQLQYALGGTNDYWFYNFKSRENGWTNPGGLQLANAWNALGIFIRDDMYLYKNNSNFSLPSFRDVVDDLFNGLVKQVDFKQRTRAVEHINDWVANETESNIARIVDDIKADTDIVLISAACMKDAWKYPFNKALTRKMPFYESEGKQREVDMMYDFGSYAYEDHDGVEILQLDFGFTGASDSFTYDSENTKMFILLPEKRFGLQDVENKLRTEWWNWDKFRIFKGIPKRPVQVRIPKFRIDSEFDLSEPLRKMGLTELFGYADFTFMTNETVSVSRVVQKTVIEISENGRQYRHEFDETFPSEFTADHPFLFIIMKHRIIVFIGRYHSF